MFRCRRSADRARTRAHCRQLRWCRSARNLHTWQGLAWLAICRLQGKMSRLERADAICDPAPEAAVTLIGRPTERKVAPRAPRKKYQQAAPLQAKNEVIWRDRIC